MAPLPSETTVAAPRTSFLRESVNAVRGLAFGRFGPAKIGNATHKRVEEVIVGDVPFVPEGARQQRAIGGSNSLATDAHNRTNKVIARPHNGSVTP